MNADFADFKHKELTANTRTKIKAVFKSRVYLRESASFLKKLTAPWQNLNCFSKSPVCYRRHPLFSKGDF